VPPFLQLRTQLAAEDGVVVAVVVESKRKHILKTEIEHKLLTPTGSHSNRSSHHSDSCCCY